MLKRKISETLKEWKEQPNHSPLVIMGIRQCGKTYISQLFAEENYKHVVYINSTFASSACLVDKGR